MASRDGHALPIQLMWPEDGEGPLVIRFDFVEAEGGWDCAGITIEPLQEGESVDPAHIQRVPLARLLKQARSGIWAQKVVEAGIMREARIAEGTPPEEIEWPPKLLKDGRTGRRGAPGLSREYLLQVAHVYNQAAAAEGPGRRRPVKAVMEQFDLVRSTAVKQIRRARQLELIGPAPNRGNSR